MPHHETLTSHVDKAGSMPPCKQPQCTQLSSLLVYLAHTCTAMISRQATPSHHTHKGSSWCRPTTASSPRAKSAAVRAINPCTLCSLQCGCDLSSSCWGSARPSGMSPAAFLIPTMPQYDAGLRSDPPRSVPVASHTCSKPPPPRTPVGHCCQAFVLGCTMPMDPGTSAGSVVCAKDFSDVSAGHQVFSGVCVA